MDQENSNYDPNNINYQADNNGSYEKLYLGNLREKFRGSGDAFLTGYICMDDLENIPSEFIKKRKDGKRYLKIVINPFIGGPNEHKNTHSCAVDTFSYKNVE